MNSEPREKVLIKYGGNAMTDKKLQKEVIRTIKSLTQENYQPILVHGGGPFIEQFLEYGKCNSEFIQGLRHTTNEAIPFVEAALRGYVNGQLVEMALQEGLKAVGLSAKDGAAVECKPKMVKILGEDKSIGRVGDVHHINTNLYQSLLDQDYFLILNSIAMHANGDSYNINADIFAGSLAAALKVDHFLVLSNIDGLMKNPKDKSSLINNISQKEMEAADDIEISEGMMPKMEACFTAARAGVKNVRIINGSAAANIKKALTESELGTRIQY